MNKAVFFSNQEIDGITLNGWYVRIGFGCRAANYRFLGLNITQAKANKLANSKKFS